MLSPGGVEDNKVESVCFNNCSGRGRCVDYACECDVGCDGDDCSFCELPHAVGGLGHAEGTNQPTVSCCVLSDMPALCFSAPYFMHRAFT